MQLDAVRCDSGLSVEHVEKAYAVDGRPTSDRSERVQRGAARADQRGACSTQPDTRRRGCAQGAGGVWKLDDHRLVEVARVRNDEVEVAVVLVLRSDQGGSDAVGGCLDPADARRIGDVGGRTETTKRADGGRPRFQPDEARSWVGQRLDGPALDPAQRGNGGCR